MELSTEELDAVVGGSLWSVFKTAVGFVPFVGTLAGLSAGTGSAVSMIAGI